MPPSLALLVAVQRPSPSHRLLFKFTPALHLVYCVLSKRKYTGQHLCRVSPATKKKYLPLPLYIHTTTPAEDVYNPDFSITNPVLPRQVRNLV